METIAEILSEEHLYCDTLFARAEETVSQGNWPQAREEFDRFAASMETHFAKEENTLFPAFEERLGYSGGPPEVMRFEHQQMRQLFTDMRAAVEQQDASEYLGLSETLLMLMRQHNAKEEQILYPMCDQALEEERPALLKKWQESK